MILSVVLLINIREFETAASQFLDIVLVFTIIYAVLGFVLLVTGVFMAIKSATSTKKFDIDEEPITASPKTSGLKIIRPSSVQQTAEGDLWFGTNEGISILERKSGVEKFTEFHKLKGGRIGFLKEDNNGTMWIGTLDLGVFSY